MSSPLADDVSSGASSPVAGPSARSHGAGAESARGSRALARLAPVIASLAVLVAAVWALTSTGTSAAEVSRYLGVWFLIVWLPGWLLWGLLAGTSRAEIELGGGAATGVALFLASWVLATAIRQPLLSVVPPLTVILASLVVPRLRRTWRRSSSVTVRRLSAYWSLTMAALACLATYKVWLTILQPSALPPGPSRIASDTWFSLGIAQQLVNGFPVADPTFAGGVIKYHWFSLALVVGTSQVSGVSLPQTLMHLWFLPFIGMWLIVVAALVRTILRPYEARYVSARRWFWGPLAALLTVVTPAALTLGGPPAPALGEGLNSSSASGAFGGLFVTALGLIAIPMLRGRPTKGTWAILVLMAAAASGMKPTVLPIAAAGCASVALAQLLRRRDAWRTAVSVFVLCLLFLAASARVVVGSTAGAKIQPFGMLTADEAYKRLFFPEAAPLPGVGGFWLGAITAHRPGTAVFLLALTALFVMGQSFRLLGLIALPWSVLRRDVAAYWCAGAVICGYLVTFLLTHSGYSQQWFAMNVSGVSVALTLSVVALAWPEKSSRWTIAVVGALLAAGVALGLAGPRIFQALTGNGEPPSLWARLAPYAMTAAAILLCAATLVVLRRRRERDITLSVVCLAAVMICGASVPASAAWLWDARPVSITTNPAATVTADEQRAALWIHDNTPTDAVLVSNVFCRPVAYRQNCDHSTVWVSALTGRVMVLDGWVYTPESAAQYDGTVPGGRLPAPFPDRLRLSLKVIRDPDQQTACELIERWRAGWIFVHAQATEVSPRLPEFAFERFSSGPVAVYQMRTAQSLGCGVS